MLRVTTNLPRVEFSMVGDDEFRRRAEGILRQADVDHDWRRRDPCADAFRSSVCEDWPFLTDADFQLIDRHSNVLHFWSTAYAVEQAAAVCQRMVGLGARLLEVDGWAMRCESSGMSHPRERWLKLASQGEQAYQRMSQADGTSREAVQDRRRLWTFLYRSLVDAPIKVYSVYYSCGMHLFGQPEMIVNETEVGTSDALGAAKELFEAFAVQLLAECGPGRFQDAPTFATGRGKSPYRMSWESSAVQAAEGEMHNPFGRLRFEGIARQDGLPESMLANKNVRPLCNRG